MHPCRVLNSSSHTPTCSTLPRSFIDLRIFVSGTLPRKQSHSSMKNSPALDFHPHFSASQHSRIPRHIEPESSSRATLSRQLNLAAESPSRVTSLVASFVPCYLTTVMQACSRTTRPLLSHRGEGSAWPMPGRWVVDPGTREVDDTSPTKFS